MNKQLRNTLLTIASLGTAVGGLVLILTQILSETKDNSLLYIAIASILLSALFNIIRLSEKSSSNKI
ncbi:MAG: zinc metallopeptidase [Firmicutes bacterium]|nr:zinc metallopeptidase [Bacillota bacterium]